MDNSLADILASIQDLIGNLDSLFDGVDNDAEAQKVISEASRPFALLATAGRVLPLLPSHEKEQIVAITYSALSPIDKLTRLQEWFRAHGY